MKITPDGIEKRSNLRITLPMKREERPGRHEEQSKPMYHVTDRIQDGAGCSR